MATWEDVQRLALALPETAEGGHFGNRGWAVKGKGFVWERPLRKNELAALGDAAPDGPILGARVENEIAKQALLADDPAVYFTTPHFDGYPAILARLGALDEDALEELVTEAWLVQAPKRLAQAFLADRM